MTEIIPTQTADATLFNLLKPQVKKAKMILRAFDHPLRQSIMKLLLEKNYIVTELYVKLRIEQSVASQHLAILRRNGLVTASRRGKNIIYSASETTLSSLLTATRSFNEKISSLQN